MKFQPTVNCLCASSSAAFEFHVGDAADVTTMKPEWNSAFDLLVSFLAIHWVQDQREALRSIKSCLKEDGVALIFLALSAPIYVESK